MLAGVQIGRFLQQGDDPVHRDGEENDVAFALEFLKRDEAIHQSPLQGDPLVFDTDEYLNRTEPLKGKGFTLETTEDGRATIKARISSHGVEKVITGEGNGPVSAFVDALGNVGVRLRVLDYNEHALRSGSGAQAASYIHLMDVKSGRATYGVGISSNITRASIRGIFSAVNRLFY